MNEFEDSMTYCLWSCACSAQQARDAQTESMRKWSVERAAEYADKAWAHYYKQYPKATEPTGGEAA